MISNNFFFILGCQRSGTTLLRLILDSHSKIHCFDESSLYDLLSNEKLLQNEISSYNENLIGFKSPILTEQMDDEFLHDDIKNIRIPNKFKNSKIIFLIRDSRDVISSMKNYVQQNGQNWLKNWPSILINRWKSKNQNFLSHYSKELNLIKNSQNKDILFGALYWKVKNNSFFCYSDSNRDILQIKYENLCQQPKATTKAITNFLGIKWEDSLLQHDSIHHSEVDKSGRTVGNVNAKKPIHKDSIGQYEIDLTKHEQEQVLKITKDLMQKFDYI